MISLSLQKKLQGNGGEFNLSIDCTIASGEITTLYGPSGSGKTSLLRMIAGLMVPEKGQIEINGEVWYSSEKKIHVEPRYRKIGFVFQDYALFPHMTVVKNLTFAADKKTDHKIIDDLLDLMELRDLKDRKPDTLSGGQQQRVALARALVRKPEILLLDEPFSALDTSMRIKLQDYLIKLHKEFSLTVLLVSHEAGEIFKLSNRVLMLEKGTIIREGNPLEAFTHYEVSGKFQFTGEILAINKEEVIYVITVLIGTTIVKVVADASEATQFAIGDKVLVASKAFNPLIRKIE